ncbi:radical SAM protein [Enterococcus sp. BWT-B8]|uniref:radical SAM protein n=1 Tax=Enterococcus sp. BWT-B8 TaxID=2885157 RepID=UPI001E3259CF|nr:radical SAM protein [Enterococcus sp. BWT-B8]MCB5953041.1 radical SAM protein [Enterococcus sp. BWT-B8]
MISSGPVSITIDITNRCNLKCLHCYNSSGEGNFSDELTDIELEKLFNDIVKIKPYNVCFCGGETLIRKDIVKKYTKLFTKNNIACSVVTNGFYLTSDLLDELVNAGINNIQISLDGAEQSHNELRQHPHAYKKAVQALELLKKYNNLYSGIAFSPTAWNINDFEHVMHIAEKTNCNEVRLQELMPIGRANQNISILPSQEQYRTLRRQVLIKERDYIEGKSNVKLDWGDPLEHLFFYTDEKKDDGAFTEMISILSDGSLTPSVYLPITFGNIKKYPLQKYWDSGLNRIWNSKIIDDLVNKFDSIQNMQLSQQAIRDLNIVNSTYDIVENFQESVRRV